MQSCVSGSILPERLELLYGCDSNNKLLRLMPDQELQPREIICLNGALYMAEISWLQQHKSSLGTILTSI